MMARYEYNEENRKRIQRVGQALLGSCGSVDDRLQEEFGEDGIDLTDFDQSLLEELDDIAAQCESCGWWCEPSAINTDLDNCEECADDD